MVKPCTMYLSHFPIKLAISLVSKSLSTFLSNLSNNSVISPHIWAISQQIYVISQIFWPFFKHLSQFPNIYVILNIFKPFVKFLSHFQDSWAVSQILKPCPMHLSHFPNILAISQISKSFSTILRSLTNN